MHIQNNLKIENHEKSNSNSELVNDRAEMTAITDKATKRNTYKFQNDMS